MYSLRHWFVTSAAKRGVIAKGVSTVVGHTSMHTIESTYCHVHGDIDCLGDTANTAAGLNAGPAAALPTVREAEVGRLLQMVRDLTAKLAALEARTGQVA